MWLNWLGVLGGLQVYQVGESGRQCLPALLLLLLPITANSDPGASPGIVDASEVAVSLTIPPAVLPPCDSHDWLPLQFLTALQFPAGPGSLS